MTLVTHSMSLLTLSMSRRGRQSFVEAASVPRVLPQRWAVGLRDLECLPRRIEPAVEWTPSSRRGPAMARGGVPIGYPSSGTVYEIVGIDSRISQRLYPPTKPRHETAGGALGSETSGPSGVAEERPRSSIWRSLYGEIDPALPSHPARTIYYPSDPPDVTLHIFRRDVESDQLKSGKASPRL